jgi:hypothetical protein
MSYDIWNIEDCVGMNRGHGSSYSHVIAESGREHCFSFDPSACKTGTPYFGVLESYLKLVKAITAASTRSRDRTRAREILKLW